MCVPDNTIRFMCDSIVEMYAMAIEFEKVGIDNTCHISGTEYWLEVKNGKEETLH